MDIVRRTLRSGFAHLEAALDRVFPPAWQPLYHLGALAFFCLWVVTVSGIYVYVFFDTGTVDAWLSVERMTVEHWYHAGVMRSLHRYASGGLVLFMLVHLLREFSLDRYRGSRWFTWVTGVVVIWLVYVSGITGYWLVWDELAQFVAIRTAELVDAIGIFGEPIARNFLSPASLDDRFFTLMLFLHIAVPLILLAFLWVHLQRVSRPEINPARGLTVMMLVGMVLLSLVKPAVSQPPADLARMLGEVRLDWYYLGLYPLADVIGQRGLLGLLAVGTICLAALPLMPPLRRAPAATVNLEFCNGCDRCVQDCPYAAVRLVPRTDGLPFEHEARVDPSLCVSCGICTGACPTATPFRQRGRMVAGIELPHLALKDLRALTDRAAEGLTGDRRVLVFGCDHGVPLDGIAGEGVGVVRLPCTGMLPPAFIDYSLSRDLADGVVLTGCAEEACFNREGIAWTEARVTRRRDPYLRERVPRERVLRVWPGKTGAALLAQELDAFRAGLPQQPSARSVPRAKAAPPADPAALSIEPAAAPGGGDD
jgi:quinol-cytochrome oxidoreductase complex cytochrome b subunit/coenzyme F420-reducing hydrogenase delta subunit/NAD-dependent dihydropyrimidine dehydrogenase PreA subunit